LEKAKRKGTYPTSEKNKLKDGGKVRYQKKRFASVSEGKRKGQIITRGQKGTKRGGGRGTVTAKKDQQQQRRMESGIVN